MYPSPIERRAINKTAYRKWKREHRNRHPDPIIEDGIIRCMQAVFEDEEYFTALHEHLGMIFEQTLQHDRNRNS